MEYFGIIYLLSGLLTVAFANPVRSLTESCKPTTPDEIGPYYYPNPPYRRQICDRDRRLHDERHLLVAGRILNEQCEPLDGARIEVWQANHDGHYLFKDNCRGYFFSQLGGHYAFLTVHPGKYSTDPSRILYRPEHIHFRVSIPGYNVLITQMYFYGDKNLGRNDSCADCSSRSEDLIVRPEEMCADESGLHCFNIVHFDFVLKKGNMVDVVKDAEDSLPELLDAAEAGK